MTKTCFKCEKEKNIDEFYKNNRMPSGYTNKCKECTKKTVAKHRLNNLDKIRAYDREIKIMDRLVRKIEKWSEEKELIGWLLMPEVDQ